MERVKKINAGAAMMTETQYEIAEDPFFMAKIPDLTLNRILMENAALVEAFQRECDKYVTNIYYIMATRGRKGLLIYFDNRRVT